MTLAEIDRELARWVMRAGYARGRAIVPEADGGNSDREILEALSNDTVQRLVSEYRNALLSGFEDSTPDVQEQRNRAKRNATYLSNDMLPRIEVDGLNNGSWR
jgi:hypothetical protein